jgi:hypothetical protein
MAIDNWTAISGGIAPGSVVGQSAGGECVVAPTSGSGAPNGAANASVLGMRALKADTDGVAAFFTNQVGFAPTVGTQDAAVDVAMKAHAGARPFVFCCLTDPPSVGARAYQLGLSSTGFLELRRGELGGGTVLRRSSAPVAPDTWLHVRLIAVVNTSGDVVLGIATNDLEVHGVQTPVWVDHPELHGFIDDALGARAFLLGASGLPLGPGYMGFGARLTGLGGAAYFDHVRCARET